MSKSSLGDACDRLSQIVDTVAFERLHWARTDGPLLAELVELTQASLTIRPEFEMSEEGATAKVKRFVIKVHGVRLIAIAMEVVGGVARIEAENIERSRYYTTQSEPLTVSMELMDEACMAKLMQAIIDRIEPIPEPKPQGDETGGQDRPSTLQ